MIKPLDLMVALRGVEIELVSGVPDSLLAEPIRALSSQGSELKHVPAPNEGSAIALAIGHYLATQKLAMVYLQNSGIGNAINPLVSLANEKVFGIPMLLMVGWRGEVDVAGNQLNDEPQHIKQGQITIQQLELLDIPFKVLDKTTLDIKPVIQELVSIAKKNSSPVALVVRKDSFEKDLVETNADNDFLPTREMAIQCIIESLRCSCVVVSTTGMASRELFEIREKTNTSNAVDFLTVGGMGHANQIATGIGLSLPDTKVLCVDGDGALLMHLGGLSVSAKCQNLIHILINNKAHDSVGGQPLSFDCSNFAVIAENMGYGYSQSVSTLPALNREMTFALDRDTSTFLEVFCKPGARSDLGRPKKSPKNNKLDLMREIGCLK